MNTKPDETCVVDAVSARNVQEHVETICADIPSRLAGSENARRMAEYNAQALRSVGVTAAVQETQGLVSFPRPGKLELLAPQRRSIEAFTSGHSPLTPAGGLSGELVYMGSGSEKDFAARDVRGKIVLCEISYSPARMEKQRIAALHGAIGAVMMNWGHPGDTALPYGSIKPVWGNPTHETVRDEMPQIPSVGVARKSGLELKALCEAGRVEVRIEADVENTWRPGADHRRRDRRARLGRFRRRRRPPGLLVRPGRHRQRSRQRLHGGARPRVQRTAPASAPRTHLRVLDGARDGHHGRLVVVRRPELGSAAPQRGRLPADRPARLYRDHALDHDVEPGDAPLPSGDRTPAAHRAFGLEAAEEGRRRVVLRSGHSDDLRHGSVHRSRTARHRRRQPGLVASLDRMHARQGRLRLDPVASARVCGLAVAVVHRADPPLRVHGGGKAVRRTPGGTRGAARHRRAGPDRCGTQARALEALAQRLDASAQDWRSRYRDGDADSEQAARVLNAALKRLSNILIPIQSTVKGVYGHDSYGYTPQLTPIPCLYDTPRYAALPAGEERYMLETHLRRQRNRVADAIADACGTITQALAQV